jgi:FlaA1/EpsC-like NDP-sugar epimerase
MGQPVKIYDLAKRMVELSGLSVKNPETGAGDIEIVVTGLRPGEKLYEELLIGENPTSTTHPRIMMAREDFLPWEALRAELALLQEGLSKDDFQVLVGQLQRLVNGYQPSGNYKP